MKLVKESISDVLVPKSEKEIYQGLEKKWAPWLVPPTNVLRTAIHSDRLPMAKYALENDAKILDDWTDRSAGNLWVAFNDGGNLDKKQDIIIEMMKTEEFDKRMKEFSNFRQSMLTKSSYMGFMRVLEYLKEHFEQSVDKKDLISAINSVEYSSWENSDEAKVFLLRWFDEKKNVNENLENILRPKTEEEIEKGISKLSGEDLYDLWRDTGNNEHLKRALKKGIPNIDRYDIAEIIEGIEGDSDLEEMLSEYIKYIGDAEVQDGHLLVFDGWDDFSNLFQENNDISKESIEKILSGDALDIFERFHDDYLSLSDIDLRFELDRSMNKELKKLIAQRVHDPTKLNDKNTFNDLFEYLQENEDDPDIKDIVNAVLIAVEEAQTVADESEAYKELVNAIKKEFGFGEPEIRDNHLTLSVDTDTLMKMFKMDNDIIEKIRYYPPQYGWTGDIEKQPEIFQDALANQLDEVDDYSVDESLENVLKPKSEEEIQQVIKNIDFSTYIEMVDDELENIRPGFDSDELIISTDFAEENFKNLVPPSTTARQALEKYYKEKWEPHGVLALTNTGGIELRLSDSGDGVQYRFTGQVIPGSAEIEYEIIDDEEEAEELGLEIGDLRNYFEDEHGERWYLDQFMRV